MKESTMATIKEVAAAAGVSYQAVSAVLNGKLGKASPATRERIYQAAARLNYRPNRLARGLVLGRSGMIGLVMQDIRSPYFADLTWELQNAAERAGFQVLTMVADWSESGTLRCLEKLSASGIDGIVLLGNVLPEAYRRRILPETFPLVLIDDDDSAADGIGFDYLPGMEEAFLHLLESGNSRIALAHDPVHRMKFRAYAACCRKFGVEPQIFQYLSPTAAGEEAVIACAHELAEARRNFDAVIAASDYDGVLLLRGLAERNVRVPEELSMVTIDDTLLGRVSIPQLTSIALDRKQLAQAILTRLSDRIAKRESPPGRRLIPSHLIIRNSVARRPFNGVF